MAEEDALYYLQPGFDFQTLTVPRIRSILVSHDVAYPSSAKKSQLIEIVEREILPKARKLLNEQARVRRTSKGITDVASQEGTIVGDDDDRGLMPPPPVPRTSRSRKSKADLASENGLPPTPTTSKRPKTPSARRGAARTPRASDTETDGEKTRRKSRKNAPAPAVVESGAVKIEEPDARLKRESLEAGDSPFTDDNPFQSGSSPPAPPSRRVSSTSRTRISASGTSTSPRKSSGKLRETASPTTVKREGGHGSTTTSKSSYEFPVRRRSTTVPPDDGVPATEEFTPEAARELAEAQKSGQVVSARPSALVRRQKKPMGTVAKTAPWVVILTLLAALGGWYRQEKINIGYCGVGEPSWSLASNPHIPAWVHETFQPRCEPCPQHAICYPKMEVRCEDDFVLKPHPLSLNGLVPLPPTCEPDSEKERRIKAVADRAIEVLRERRAAFECGDTVTSVPGGAPVSEDVNTVVKGSETKLEIPEETLKKEVGKMRRKGMSAEEFEDLWRGALGDILSRDEIDVTKDTR